MKIAIMQPYVFPYMGYFQLYNSVDLFISLEDVNYIKRGWINRNKIMVNGTPSYITFPVVAASQNRLINQHYVYWDDIWPNKMLKKIRHAYSSSKHFDDVYPEIEILFHRRGPDCIAGFAMAALTHLGDLLGIKTETKWSLHYTKEGLKGQDRLINICKQTGATTYVNAIGGMEMYDQNSFGDINLRFIKRLDEENNLSIIDILMRRGWEETAELINQYELITGT